jgi:hypothetical protein
MIGMRVLFGFASNAATGLDVRKRVVCEWRWMDGLKSSVDELLKPFDLT